MNFILRIFVPSTLNVVAQHTEALIVILDLTPNISKQSTLHDQVIILSGIRVHVNKSHEICYSFDSR